MRALRPNEREPGPGPYDQHIVSREAPEGCPCRDAVLSLLVLRCARDTNQMSDDIPFDKAFDLAPGKVEEVMPGVRRILANNPSPFTFRGTVSYIVGRGHVAIIDPGPLDEAHIGALLDAVRGRPSPTSSSPIRIGTIPRRCRP